MQLSVLECVLDAQGQRNLLIWTFLGEVMSDVLFVVERHTDGHYFLVRHSVPLDAIRHLCLFTGFIFASTCRCVTQNALGLSLLSLQYLRSRGCYLVFLPEELHSKECHKPFLAVLTHAPAHDQVNLLFFSIASCLAPLLTS